MWIECETPLKCNLDRTELQRRTYAVLRIFNLMANTSIKRNRHAELKKSGALQFRWRQVSLYCHFSAVELVGIYLNNYRMCPQFTKGSDAGVTAPAIVVVQNLGYTKGWILCGLQLVLSCNMWVQGMCETWQILWLFLCMIWCLGLLRNAFNLLPNSSLP